MTEPSDITVTVTRGGVQTDITEGVKVLYDSIIGSMDWGSGFLSTDEVHDILAVGDACGFLNEEQAEYRALLMELRSRVDKSRIDDALVYSSNGDPTRLRKLKAELDKAKGDRDGADQ